MPRKENLLASCIVRKYVIYYYHKIKKELYQRTIKDKREVKSMQIIMTREEKRKVRRFIRRAIKNLKVVLVVIYFILAFIICGRIESQYKIEAKITELNGYTYTAVDVAGYEWKFTDERLFPEGTKVKLKMYNGLTTTRTDDEVRDVKPMK